MKKSMPPVSFHLRAAQDAPSAPFYRVLFFGENAHDEAFFTGFFEVHRHFFLVILGDADV
jgi:hypothetical protein